MELARALDKRRLLLWEVRVGNAAIDRACRGALFLVEETDAFAALVGRNVIDVLPKRRMLAAVQLPTLSALVNRVVRACRLACTTIDTRLRNQC